MRGLAFAVVLAACGRVHFRTHADAGAGADPDAAIDARVFDIDAGECPPTYQFVGTSCYRAEVASPTTWVAAEALCEADGVGAHLVIVADAAEASTIDALVPPAIVNHWIGDSERATPGVFLDVTGAPMTYLNWAAGEPTGGACVEFDDSRTIDEVPCDTGNEYICEYDGVAAVH